MAETEPTASAGFSNIRTSERQIPHTNQSAYSDNGGARVITGATTASDGKFVCLKSDYQKQLEDEAVPLRDKALAAIDKQIQDYGTANGLLDSSGQPTFPGAENLLKNGESSSLYQSRDIALQRPLSDYLSGTKRDHLAYMINLDQVMAQKKDWLEAESYMMEDCNKKHAVTPSTNLSWSDKIFRSASGAGQQTAELVNQGVQGVIGVGPLNSALKGTIAESQSRRLTSFSDDIASSKTSGTTLPEAPAASAPSTTVPKGEIGVRQQIPDGTIGFVKKEAPRARKAEKDTNKPETTKSDPEPPKGVDKGEDVNADTTTAGEPVSVTNGEYLETWRDFFIPGTLGFDGSRYMGLKLALPSGYTSPLGPCQISMFDEVFSNPSRGKLLFHNADGKAIAFDRPFNFLPSINAGYPHLQLKAPWLKQLELKDRGIVKHFRQYDDDVYRLEKIEDLNGNSLTFFRSDAGWLKRVEGPDGLSLLFDNDGEGRRRLIRLIGTDGSELELARYSYDAKGRMTQATCAFGMSVHYVWESGRDLLVSWNNLTRQSETHFTYDDDGRVINTRTNGIWNNDRFDYREGETRYLPGGVDAQAQTFRFDENENVTAEVDAHGGVVAHSYDRHGFRISTKNQNGHETRTRYDALGNVKELTDPEGRSTVYGWGDNGELLIAIDGAGNKRVYGHDEHGNVISEKDAEGHETRLVRDARGRVVETRFANGAVERRAWDAFNRLVSITDAKGHATRFGYDAFNRLIETVGPNGAVTRQSYDAGAGGFDTVSAMVRADGVDVTRSFDGAGQLASVSDGEGRKWRYRYGAFGVLEVIRDPAGGELRLKTDNEGRVISVTNAVGQVYRFERDAAGRVVAEQDFDGRLWRYARDAAGQIVETTKPDGAQLFYTYDKSGLVTRIESVTAKGEPEDVTRFWHDARGLLIRAENSAALVEFERDRNGRIVAESLNGKRIKSKRDVMGNRILRDITGLGGTLTRTIRDPLGVIEGMVAGETEISFQRDALGRETERRMGGFHLRQRYDIAGQLIAQTAGPVVTGGGPGMMPRTDWILSANGAKRVSGSRPDPVQRLYRYDRAFAPVSIDDALWGRRRFNYDRNGQLTAAESASGSEGFEYDAARNVSGASTSLATAADQPPPFGRAPGETFRSTVQAPKPQAWQRTAGGVVQIARGPRGEKIALTHDDCGRLIERRVERDGFRPQRWRYRWDGHDRLVGVTTLDGEEWLFRYDPFGRRVSKVRRLAADERQKAALRWPDLVSGDGVPRPAGSGSEARTRDPDLPDVGTAYLWDGDHMVAEAPLSLDGHIAWDQATHWHFEEGSHRLIAKQLPSGQMLAIVSDHLGTPKEMFDEKGTLIWAADHHVWGAIKSQRVFGALALAPEHDLSPDAARCPWRFPGQYEDTETGLYYNRHRHYDPLTGQYASPDPIGLAGGDRPQGYVENPNTLVDVLGLSAAFNRTLDNSGTPSYKNRYPGDEIFPGSGQELHLRPDGRWKIGEGPSEITPKGTYAFITKSDGTIVVTKRGSVRGERYSSHLALSKGGNVRYAGQVQFSGKGKLTEWNNGSGHYTPLASDSYHSGFPTDLFKPFELTK